MASEGLVPVNIYALRRDATQFLRERSPYLMSHNRTVVSNEPAREGARVQPSDSPQKNRLETAFRMVADAPLARTLASAFHATVLILPTCPPSLRMMSPDVTSHKKTERSPPHEAIRVLSYELHQVRSLVSRPFSLREDGYGSQRVLPR